MADGSCTLIFFTMATIEPVSAASVSLPPDATIGALLRHWRTVRRMSQLQLALHAGISSRHLSYLETGRARPSRDMVLHLADALEIPLRERNALLVAAGYAARFFETGLAAPELTQMRNAIDLILQHQEPYPAFLLDRNWNIRMTNRAAERCTRFLLDADPGEPNMIKLVARPDGLRPVLVNWEEIAGDLIRHLHNQIAATPSDAYARDLLAEVLSYPGVPARWRAREIGVPSAPLLTTHFRKGDVDLRFFSTITMFGTPHDVTLEELRIESSFPADEATRAWCDATLRSG
jgi:transcriptional regulator with XRE-family HTH domain